MARPNAYGRGQALDGDKTTSGATLISTLSRRATCNRRGIIRRGDPTTACPKCGKPGVVAEGDTRIKWLGEPTAVDGHIVSCGCPFGSNRIIAPLGSLSPKSTSHPPSPTAEYAPAQATEKTITQNQFDLQFLLIDSSTKNVKPNTPYRITTETGDIFEGISDKNGLTQKIAADSPIKVTIEAPYYDSAEPATHCTDNCQH